MIIEGLITCGTPAGPHVAALGPVVNQELTEWTLRPFQSSTIFTLLHSNPTCVFHVIDDALSIVELVLGQSPRFTLEQLDSGGWMIREACHWYQLEVQAWELQDQRSEAQARLVSQGHIRPFWGWNRAKHALLEAAILISRAGIIPADQLDLQLDQLQSPIAKTAGPRELAAWQLIQKWRCR